MYCLSLNRKSIPAALSWPILIMALFLTIGVYGQAPVISGNAVPVVVTYRSQITITGQSLGSSTVKVNGTAATIVSNTGTQIIATVPQLTLSANVASATVPVLVTKSSVDYPAGNVTYVKPASTNTNLAKATRVITDFQGYWSSNNTTTTAALQPDRQHSVTAMEFNGVIYSTGVDDATLTAKGVSFVPGDFKSLPINSITGTSGTSSNYIALATKMDGNATSLVPTAPGVAGLITKDILIDGVKGLGLGSGMTNITETATMLFNVNNIVTSRINDNEPDIIVSQTAEPTNDVYDVYSFTDANGNIVGNPVYVVLNSIPAIGTYKVDLFSITGNVSYDTATITATQSQTPSTRPIRLVGYRLSDFGITDANKSQITGFKIMNSGVSDPAFIAYNGNSLLIPAPQITQQPVSVVACTGAGNSVSFSVTATGSNLMYQWKKNGINISGATASTYTLYNVSTADVAMYSAEVKNAAGTVISNMAYLNTIISVQPVSNTACLNSPGPTIDVIANGLNLTYQWYSNATNSNTGGTAIGGATSASYAPPASAAGTRYYYCVIMNSGAGCTSQTTNAVSFVVGNAAAAGTAYIGGTAGTSNNVSTVSQCPSTTATIRAVGNSSGTGITVQWESSSDGESGWNSVTGGTGGTSAAYTTASLTATTYFRLRITNSSCTNYSNTVVVNIATTPGTISADQAICANTTTTVSLVGATGNIQWQQSSTGTSNWASVTGGSGANTATYTTPALTANRYYRAVMTSGSCTSTSATTLVTVNAAAVAGTVTSNQTICPATTATLSVSGTTGTLQWQLSANQSVWTDIVGATASSYTTTALAATTYYRVLATNGNCSATSDVITVTVNDTFTWTGTTSTNWHTAGNWSCNTIPTLTSNVIIPQTTNKPQVQDGTALAKTLTVQAGATLKVLSGYNINVLGAVTVAETAGFEIENNANLIQDALATTNTNSGKITIARNSNLLYRLDYTLWSSPVAAQNLFGFSPLTTANRFYTYNPVTDAYSGISGLSSTATTTFQNGVAYLIRMPNSSDIAGYNAGTKAIAYKGIYNGTPNNGTIHVPVSTEGQRYNAIGNPYPSPINVFGFIDGNAASLADGTLYFWRKKNNQNNSSYATITKFAYTRNSAEGGDASESAFTEGLENNWTMNVGQGMIVKVAQAATQVSFTNSMRRLANNNQLFRQATEGSTSKMWLALTSASGNYSQAVVGYSENTTTGFDFGYDGKALNDGIINLSTVSDGEKLAIQARGTFTDTDVATIAYRANDAGTFNLKLENSTGVFANGQQVILKDKLLQNIHDITTGSYTFETEAGSFENRFEIVYASTVLGNGKNPVANNSISVYTNKDGVGITAANGQIKNVQVYDVRGRLISVNNNLNNNNNNNTITLKNIIPASQLLIVDVVMDSGMHIYKKVIY